jgi:hypothetical protein
MSGAGVAYDHPDQPIYRYESRGNPSMINPFWPGKVSPVTPIDKGKKKTEVNSNYKIETYSETTIVHWE